ncbi:Hypothetical protein I595_1385 [Croceitalea dokdonensis DOKDO 023]|uniref:Uncharacterized protein n=1 Tax=Croceitalea dokdonensis DOKDO 023 TaxID=1300341 RepID=A0A0P7AY11_9FLAO|nr:Hypothetical protein I595_1385 [Croceitalea dokdonensis DOKDO 023]
MQVLTKPRQRSTAKNNGIAKTISHRILGNLQFPFSINF